jgi:hypothetical protein
MLWNSSDEMFNELSSALITAPSVFVGLESSDESVDLALGLTPRKE